MRLLVVLVFSCLENKQFDFFFNNGRIQKKENKMKKKDYLRYHCSCLIMMCFKINDARNANRKVKFMYVHVENRNYK